MKYQAEDQNEYAKNTRGEIKFILEVERGTKGFRCLGCHEPMHPVRRTVEHYKSYFRHEARDVSVEKKCTFSSEKARRILAMDILGRTKRIKVPNLYKYSPDGQSKILIKDAGYVEAASVKGDITFYNDEAGLLKWGKNPDIEESAVLMQPDITFFDILQNPILLIQFVEKYKITEEKRLKVRELGIDVVQMIIPKDSPENIAKSLEVTQHTRWMYNHTEQNTDYAQLQHRNRERISISDAVEMGFFKETFTCRESQINNFIRKVTRYLGSQHYRGSEQQLRDRLSGVESDTIRDRAELEHLRSTARERVEARYSGEIESIEKGESEFRFSLGATQGEVRAKETELERGYLNKRERIISRRREVEKLIRDYDDTEQSAKAIRAEQSIIEDEIQATESRIKEAIRSRESAPERFKFLEEQEQSRAERERGRIRAATEQIPEQLEQRRRAISAAFEADRERTIKTIEDRDCSGTTELSSGIKRILDQRRTLLNWDEVQGPYNRNRKAYDCFTDRTYKSWFER